MAILKCPVCHQGLHLEGQSYKCEHNHCYDLSKYDYVNLLLANQIHSDSPGDSSEMILARKRFLELDYYHILRKKIVEIIQKYAKNHTCFCDLACGEGYYTNYIHQQLLNVDFDFTTYGVDLSKRAIREASKTKRMNQLQHIDYVIGNLMYLPFMNQSFDVMLNCFAPMFDKEFARVLKDNGIYIRVLPGADHLYELKAVLYETVDKNVLKELNVPQFELIEQIAVEDTILLKSSQEISDLFTMTPYYYKSPKDTSQKLCSMNQLQTKIAFIILVYQKNKSY